MKNTCPALPSVLLVLFCLFLLAEQTVAQGTFYTDEATFLSVAGLGGISLNLESFESISGSAPITVGDITISNTGGGLVNVSPNQSTDGLQGIGWSSSASNPITYTFANPIKAFGIDILDLGTPGLTDLTLTTTTGSTLLFDNFFGGSGNQLFGGYVDLSQSFTSVTFSNSLAGDIVYFDRLQYGQFPILVDPDNIGATNVLLDPFGTPTPLTNPVSSPLIVSDLSVGHNSAGHLNVFGSGQITASGRIGIGWFNGSSGKLNVIGGTVDSTQLDVGVFETGELVLNSGGTINTSRFNLGAGFQPGSVATVDGVGTTLNIDATIPASGLRLISGAMDVTGGANVIVTDDGSGSSYIGGTGTTADLLIDGAGSLVHIDEDFDIGGFWSSQPAVASVTVQNLGAMSVEGTASLGEADDTLTINGGLLTVGSLDNSNGGTLNHNDGAITIDGGTFDDGLTSLKVASTSGTPLLRYINGASSSETTVRIGELNSEDGAIEIRDPNSKLSTTADFYVADEVGSKGTLDVSNGGLVNVGDDLLVGITGGQGTVNIDPNGTINVADETTVGRDDGAASFLFINDGILNATDKLVVARDPNSEGHVIVIGASAQANIGFDTGVAAIDLGLDGLGTMTVQGGANVNSTADVYLGRNSTGDGTLDITDPNSQVLVDGTAYVGGSGTGTLNLSNGGKLETGNNLSVGNSPGSEGVVTIAGSETELNIGTSTGSGQLLLGIDGKGTATVQSGAKVFTARGLRLGHSDPNSEGTLTIDGTGSQVTVDPNFPFFAMAVGNNGSGTLHITNGGSMTNLDARIGNASTAVGIATVDGTDPNGNASTWNNNGSLIVGDQGLGTLTVTAGGVVSSSSGLLGDSSGSTGTVTVSGTAANGAPSTWTNSQQLEIGETGTGTLEITGGGIVTNTLGRVGLFSGSSGTVTVSGTDSNGTPSTWSNSAQLQVGDRGSGTLEITGGGIVTSDSGTIGGIGHDSIGNVTVSGTAANGSPSTWDNYGALWLGINGAGTLEIFGGGRVSNTDGFLATSVSSTGTVTVDGTDPNGNPSIWNNTGSLYIGGNACCNFGSGSLTIQNSGAVQVAGNTELGRADDTLTIDGGSLTTGSLVNFGGTLNHYDGNLAVNNGTFSPNSSGDYLVKGQGSADHAILTLTGASTIWNAPGSVKVGENSGDGTLNIELGAQLHTTSHMLVGITGSQMTTGSLNISGGSTLSTGGNLGVGIHNNKTGVMNVSGGSTVATHLVEIGEFTNSMGSIHVQDPNTQFTADDVHIGGGLGGGGGTGLLAVTNSAFFTSAGTVSIYGDGTLNITDQALVTIDGTLNVDLENTGTSFVNMTSGGKLALLGDADDSLSQFLDLVSGTDAIRYWDDGLASWELLTSATMGVDYSLHYLSSGELAGYTLLTVGDLGDFDGDGTVDGSDFLSWQRGASLGPLADWTDNYGTTYSTTANATTVPEPSSLFLFALCSVAFAHRRRQDTSTRKPSSAINRKIE